MGCRERQSERGHSTAFATEKTMAKFENGRFRGDVRSFGNFSGSFGSAEGSWVPVNFSLRDTLVGE